MRSISELNREATTYEWSQNVNFGIWVRVAQRILREARVYDQEGALDRAFVLYVRYADLVLNRLPGHPQFTKAGVQPLNKQVPDVIGAAERIKKEYSELVANQPQPSPELDPQPQPSPGLDPQPQPEQKKKQKPRTQNSLELGDGLAVLSALKGNSPATHSAPSVRTTINYPSLHQPTTTKPNQQGPPEDSGPPQPASEFKPTSSGLRQMFVPASLRSSFLDIAQRNTTNNIETCGILAGKLNRNAFFVTHLVVPEQHGTSDTCATDNEEGMFEYLDSNDLFVLGWIHTHPRQSCFMSSVDLHTHASYQLMLPEAVALVCAPSKDPNFGAFMLTDPYGLGVIRNCPRSGFHPHQEHDLYSLALPGHVALYKYDFEVKDLR